VVNLLGMVRLGSPSVVLPVSAGSLASSVVGFPPRVAHDLCAGGRGPALVVTDSDEVEPRHCPKNAWGGRSVSGGRMVTLGFPSVVHTSSIGPLAPRALSGNAQIGGSQVLLVGSAQFRCPQLCPVVVMGLIGLVLSAWGQ
jgi:hypothetical protein